MNFEAFFKELLNDVKTELADEFDRNFERKAFFDEAWIVSKRNVKGSLMMRTGALRRSIQAKIEGMGIHFSSSLPYASIHNLGGEIIVTAKMKKFFWAMYIQVAGIKKDAGGKSNWKNETNFSKRKDGTVSNTQKNIAIIVEAEYWKNLALMKVGDKLKIPKRKFIGHHPIIDDAIEQIAVQKTDELTKHITSLFKQNK